MEEEARPPRGWAKGGIARDWLVEISRRRRWCTEDGRVAAVGVHAVEGKGRHTVARCGGMKRLPQPPHRGRDSVVQDSGYERAVVTASAIYAMFPIRPSLLLRWWPS